jgi:hypothetical protein
MRYIRFVVFSLGRMGRCGLLVVMVFLAGCSARAAGTLAPLPSPTIAVVATHTSPPPTGTFTTVPATGTATLAPAVTHTPTHPLTPTPPPSPTADPALAVIYSYLDARAQANVADVTALVCRAFQGQAATEAVSFRSMQATLQDVVCAVSGVSGPYTLVGCQGKIITKYGTETR